MLECAKQLGVSIATIHKAVKRLGFDTALRKGSGRRGKSKGRFVRKTGYVLIYAPNHPATNHLSPYIFEHRIVMEQHIGRFLLPGEVIHHINGDRADNRIENLQLFRNNGEHSKHHQSERGWSMRHECCIECGTTERRHEARGRCYLCNSRLKRNQ
jgi:hypothetical protein